MNKAKILFNKIDEISYNMLKEFVDEFKQWKNSVVKKDYKDDYLIGQIYKENVLFKKNKDEYTQLCRCHVCLALKCLEALLLRIEKEQINPAVYKQHIFEYIFDLKEYVEHIRKKDDQDYSFINGGKSYHDLSCVMFQEAKNLFWASTLDKESPISYRTALPLSVFALRRAIEVRLRRAIGIYKIVDENLKDAKLRHDFMFDFFKENLDLVELKIDSIENLSKIYKWTNYTIHNGFIPKMWEVEYAFQYVSSLFEPDKPEHGQSWNIHSSVKIKDYKKLKQNFEDSVKQEFSDDRDWNFRYFKKLEAVIMHETECHDNSRRS